MVRSCSAFGCKNRDNKIHPEISFHVFPLNKPDLLKKWIVAVRRKDWIPSKHSCLCSFHFLEEDFYPRLLGTVTMRLKEDAVPSVFAFSIKSSNKKQKTLKSKASVNAAKRPSPYEKNNILHDASHSSTKVLASSSLRTSNLHEPSGVLADSDSITFSDTKVLASSSLQTSNLHEPTRVFVDGDNTTSSSTKVLSSSSLRTSSLDEPSKVSLDGDNITSSGTKVLASSSLQTSNLDELSSVLADGDSITTSNINGPLEFPPRARKSIKPGDCITIIKVRYI